MKIDVAHIAKLANLPLTPEEKEKFERQLEETLEFVSILNQVNTKDVKPTDQVTGLTNVVRTDESAASLTQQAALKNSKSTINGFFKVKAVLEHE